MGVGSSGKPRAALAVPGHRYYLGGQSAPTFPRIGLGERMLATERQGRESADERATSGRRMAALDLGTNNCRLLVAEPTRDGFRVVDSFSRIVRLGEGLAATGDLSEPAIQRTLAALKVCRRIMDRHRVARARCVATEACRTGPQRP